MQSLSVERNMPQSKGTYPPKNMKIVSREEIMNFESTTRQIQLPSGAIVCVKYLAYFVVYFVNFHPNNEILNSR